MTINYIFGCLHNILHTSWVARQCSQSRFWTQFLAIGTSFYFMVMKIVFMWLKNDWHQLLTVLLLVVVGWVGLGWVGSILLDLRWVRLCWVTRLMGYIGWVGSLDWWVGLVGHRKWTHGQFCLPCSYCINSVHWWLPQNKWNINTFVTFLLFCPCYPTNAAFCRI